MKNSKLLELLRALDGPEFRQFCDFVGSPYFNKNEDLCRLAMHLEALAPDFHPEKIKKEQIFQHLFPKDPCLLNT